MPAWRDFDRDQLLAETAELYYVQHLTQQEISDRLGTTRSTVSRMIAEAQERGLVEIRVHVPLRLDHGLEQHFTERFGLSAAMVVESAMDDEGVLGRVGTAGARLLAGQIADGMTIGMTWGSTLQAIVAAFPEEAHDGVRVVQVAGALGAQTETFDSAPLVQELARRVGGAAVLLNAPLLVESPTTAHSLMRNPSNRHAIELARHCDIVLVGVGIMDPDWSTLYLGGHISRDELERLREKGAIGDACGHPFDADGSPVSAEWSERLVGISREALLNTPVRLGFAAGAPKAHPLLGALKGGYISHLVTDVAAAREMLRLLSEPAAAGVDRAAPSPSDTVA